MLADYESDLESFSAEHLVSVINQQGGGAPSQHDPNEALDQISEDNLTQDAPPDEDEATRTTHRARNQHKEEHRARAAERAHLPPRNLNNEFNNAADPVFTTPNQRWNVSYTLPKMLLNNSRDKTRCPRFTALGRGPPQQSYLKQAVLLEAIIVNISWSSKTKETKRIKKLQVYIVPWVVNYQQTKLLGLSQVATTTTAGTTGRK